MINFNGLGHPGVRYMERYSGGVSAPFGSLNGFGALGGDAFGVNFTNNDALTDFTGGVDLSDHRWGGTPAGLSRQISTAISEAVGEKGEKAVETYTARAQDYADSISKLQRFGLGSPRSKSQDLEFLSEMQGLRDFVLSSITRINQANQQDKVDEAAPALAAAAKKAAAEEKEKEKEAKDALAAGKKLKTDELSAATDKALDKLLAARRLRESSQQGLVGDKKKDKDGIPKWALPVGLGVGAMLLFAIVLRK